MPEAVGNAVEKWVWSNNGVWFWSKMWLAQEMTLLFSGRVSRPFSSGDIAPSMSPEDSVKYDDISRSCSWNVPQTDLAAQTCFDAGKRPDFDHRKSLELESFQATLKTIIISIVGSPDQIPRNLHRKICQMWKPSNSNPWKPTNSKKMMSWNYTVASKIHSSWKRSRMGGRMADKMWVFTFILGHGDEIF